MANEDGAKGDADKMGAGNAQVIEQAQYVLGHSPKAVVPLDHLLQLVGLAVAAKIQQQHVEVLTVGAQLLEPDGRAAAGAVHEHHPIPLGAELGQVADEDGAKGDADKMGAGDAQMIEQAQDVLGHGTKTVVSLDHLL